MTFTNDLHMEASTYFSALPIFSESYWPRLSQEPNSHQSASLSPIAMLLQGQGRYCGWRLLLFGNMLATVLHMYKRWKIKRHESKRRPARSKKVVSLPWSQISRSRKTSFPARPSYWWHIYRTFNGTWPIKAPDKAWLFHAAATSPHFCHWPSASQLTGLGIVKVSLNHDPYPAMFSARLNSRNILRFVCIGHTSHVMWILMSLIFLPWQTDNIWQLASFHFLSFLSYSLSPDITSVDWFWRSSGGKG